MEPDLVSRELLEEVQGRADLMQTIAWALAGTISLFTSAAIHYLRGRIAAMDSEMAQLRADSMAHRASVERMRQERSVE